VTRHRRGELLHVQAQRRDFLCRQAGQVQANVLLDRPRLQVAANQKPGPVGFFDALEIEHVEPTAPMLEGLAGAKSFAKVRFISEEPLKDMRHLRFLAYAADAIAELGNGSVIFDVVAEKLYSPAEFGEKLDALGDATDADFQTDVVWSRSAAGGIAETRGLEKVGLPELATEEMNTDQRVLVTAILEGVIRQVWTLDTLPPAADVNYFDDHYRVEIKQTRKGPAKVTLMRMPS